MRRLIALLLVLAVALAVAPAAAQESAIREASLSHDLERELLRLYDGGARRIDGSYLVKRGEVVRTSLAALGGTLRVAGRIEGDVAMVDGDVVLEPGSRVTGDVTVIGGEVRLEEAAEVEGTVTAYGPSYPAPRYAGDDDRDRDDRWRGRDARYPRRGYSRLTLTSGARYNRVEGLPFMLGPILDTGGSNPFRVKALAIWRTESGSSLDTDEAGYQVEAEQFFGGHRRWSLGGTLFSVVDPMDPWQIRDLEASLAAGLFHDDYRDYFGRTGWSAFVRARPVRAVDARLEYRREEYDALPAGDPWTLFDDDDVWRSQPLVAEGELDVVSAALELDLRDRRDDPYEGWYGRLSVERPVRGDLVRPELLAPVPPTTPGSSPPVVYAPATELDSDFTTGLIDLRRYTPLGYHSQLNLRVVAGGTIEERPLPPQFQHVLGGIGSLPGFESFYGDCGARAYLGAAEEASFYPSYGCDRFALAQVEYRGGLSLDFGLGEPDDDDDGWWHDVEIDLDPTWVVFFDVGRGWAYDGDPAFQSGRRTTGTLYDAGLGFLFEDVGVYMALPLNDEFDQDPRFIIRLGRRF